MADGAGHEVSQVGVLVAAAGLGLRLGGGTAKALRLLAGEPLLVHAVRGLRAAPSVGRIVVAAPQADLPAVVDLLRVYDVQVVPGGATRDASVGCALAALPAAVQLLLVHDAARCLTPPQVVEDVVHALRAGADAVVPVVPVPDTIKQVSGDVVTATLPRAELRAVQTPQGFRRSVLERVRAGRLGSPTDAHTDDAGLVEAAGFVVRTVPGHERARKITGPVDLLLAEALLRA